jgi:hypothetical protein
MTDSVATAAPGRPLTIIARLRNVEPATLLWVALAAVLLVLVAYPMGKLLVTSFETRGTGAFTIENYLTAYGRARYLDALVNSLTLGLLAAGISMALAVPLAWAVSRTDMPGKPIVWIAVLGAFILPPFLGAIGWILLAGPNAGFINQIWALGDRGAGAAGQRLQLPRPRPRHRAAFLPAHLHLREVGAGSRLVGDGGRRQHPGRGQLRDHPQDHAAAGLAGHHRRHHRRLPRDDRPVRHAGHHRHSGPHQRRHHAALAVLRVSGPGRGWRRPTPCRC